MKKIFLISSVVAANIYAAGFLLPSSSVDGLALGGADIAKSYSPSVSNPANMSLLPNNNMFELGVNYSKKGKSKADIFDKILDKEDTSTGKQPTSKREIDPSFFYVSPELYNGLRLGLSYDTPANYNIKSVLAHFYKNYQLKISEFTSGLSFRLNQSTTLGGGVRYIRANGKQLDLYDLVSDKQKQHLELSDDKVGHAHNFGYKLGLNYQANENLNFGAVYSSEVKLNLKGHYVEKSLIANMNNGDAGNIQLPTYLPASLKLGVAYSLQDQDILFGITRTFFSSIKEHIFKRGEIKDPSGKLLFQTGFLKERFYPKDANTYSLGYVYKGINNLRLIAGLSYNEATLASNNIHFSYFDTKSFSYSGGFDYKITNNFSVASALMVRTYKKRDAEIVSFDTTFKNKPSIYSNLSFKFEF